jgi:hypothetical protein
LLAPELWPLFHNATTSRRPAAGADANFTVIEDGAYADPFDHCGTEGVAVLGGAVAVERGESGCGDASDSVLALPESGAGGSAELFEPPLLLQAGTSAATQASSIALVRNVFDWFLSMQSSIARPPRTC